MEANSICFSVNGRIATRVSASTPIGVPSRSIGTASDRAEPTQPLVNVGVIRVGLDIRNVNKPAFEQGAPGGRATRQRDRTLLHEMHEVIRVAIARREPQHVTVRPDDAGHVRLAQPSGRLDQRVKHRLQIESRAADDLEHVGGRGLLLQRFAQLVEQPRVLDGDDGLLGEVCDQLDLLVGEWPTSWR